MVTPQLAAPASLRTLWIRGEGAKGRLEKSIYPITSETTERSPRAGNAAVGGATPAFPAMRGDSVTADSQGADSSSLNACEQMVESEGSLVHC